MSDDEKSRGRPGRKSKASAVASEYSDNDDEEQPKRKQSKKSNGERKKVSDATIVNDDFVEEEDLVRDERGETEHEAGQIMRVYVQDFMCHHKLTMDFGRHVNFVTGANGSGNDLILWCHYPRSFEITSNNLVRTCRQICRGRSRPALPRSHSEKYWKRNESERPHKRRF
jgi:hypothetical protein